MNTKNGIEVASAVKDVYLICADLPENVYFEIEIDVRWNGFKVCIRDLRTEYKYNSFEYHKDMSLELNAIGLKEWIATIL